MVDRVESKARGGSPALGVMDPDVRGGDGLPCEGGKWKKRDTVDGDKLDLVRAEQVDAISRCENFIRTRSRRRWGCKIDAHNSLCVKFTLRSSLRPRHKVRPLRSPRPLLAWLLLLKLLVA